MSSYVTYVRLKPFIAQWLIHAFGSPVRFPNGSPENALMHRRCIMLPRDASPDVAGEGLTAIAIPDCRERPARTYHYLPEAGKRELVLLVESLFTLSWRQELLAEIIKPGVNIDDTVRQWCKAHGIDPDFAETIRQRIYRWRSTLRDHGISTRKRRVPSSRFHKKN